jgi:hypothetical protein
MAGVPERGVEREALAGAEPVEGDREVVDTDLGHGRLLGDRVLAMCNWVWRT